MRNSRPYFFQNYMEVKLVITYSGIYKNEKNFKRSTIQLFKSKVSLYQINCNLRKNFIIFQAEYAKSLRKLEEISESIHAQRKLKQKLNQFREPGVGAEEYLKSLPSYDLDDCYERSTVSGQSSSRIGMNFYLVKSDLTYISNSLLFTLFWQIF